LRRGEKAELIISLVHLGFGFGWIDATKRAIFQAAAS